MPKPAPGFRPVSQIQSPATRKYQALHSPVASSSDSTTPNSNSTYPRVPERALVRRERDSMYTDTTRTTASGRGRKLKKPRMVEGDWELVRRDTQSEWRAGRQETEMDMTAADARTTAGEREAGIGGKEARTASAS